MSITCMGCRHYRKTMIRGQYFNICHRNMVTAPFRACKHHEPRFQQPPKRNQEQEQPKSF
jgi:hypothetical protein